MTEQEKFKAIKERAPLLDDTITAQHVSFMLIVGYLNALYKEGMVTQGEYDVTPLGENIIAICEEFDWKPSDNDIETFIAGMIPLEDHSSFRYFLFQYRDNRMELMEKIKRFKDDLTN